MSDVNPSQPPDQNKPAGNAPAGGSSGISGYKPFSAKGGPGLEAYRKWLGPKGYKQFVSTLCQSISNEIKREQQMQDLAARKLKASAEGKDPDEITE